MKELFRERDFTRVGYFQSILESRGIPTLVRNENQPMTGLAEIPNALPALCVVNDEDYDRAIGILREHVSHDIVKSEKGITCQGCGESNPGNFEICWSCGAAITAIDS